METSGSGLKIGLAFSGGGFRASAFNLGVLTYLNEIKLNNEPLLKSVVALSTVSGGTITGIRYAIGIKKREPFDKIYKDLYEFMSKPNLIDLSLQRLISDKGWPEGRIKSIINAFADIYDEYLFKGEKFGTLLSNENPVHLKHISFNATEFAHGLQFRFQVSEKIKNPGKDAPDKGLIGNIHYRLTHVLASQIRMADILAASSCFPAGFEPINFPTDFVLPAMVELDEMKKSEKYPVGLMDGGIVDNQGIEPLLLANNRMKLNEPQNNSNPIDVLLISDVASPYVDSFKATEQKKSNWFRNLTPGSVIVSNSVILLLAILLLFFSVKNNWIVATIALSMLITLNLVVYIIGSYLKSLPGKLNVPKEFLKPLGMFLKLKFGIYDTIVSNRINSVLKMANEVFLKNVRGLQYYKVYNNDSWKNRRIMNAVYELRKEEPELKRKIESGKLSKELIPNDKIQEISTKAASMGTTLWFTKNELEKENMLNTLIACGQFNVCWNLLEYIENLEKDNTNTNSNHRALMSCKNEMLSHWQKFNDDPFWMVNEQNKKTN